MTLIDEPKPTFLEKIVSYADSEIKVYLFSLTNIFFK